MKDLFIPLDINYPFDKTFTNPFNYTPDALSLTAVTDLQLFLKSKDDFGLINSRKGKQIGKMFGVLVVETLNNELGYLRAFSGKLLGSNIHETFVPPIYDSLHEGGFLNRGMLEVTRLGVEISIEEDKGKRERLIQERRELSHSLQERLFDEYNFLNSKREVKNVRGVFDNYGRKKLPAGAGECALPKLLQFAFKHDLKPLRMAEFWWGKSPKANNRIHGEFYPSCEEKCRPILTYMLNEEYK